jgi:hypothetical protein
LGSEGKPQSRRLRGVNTRSHTPSGRTGRGVHGARRPPRERRSSQWRSAPRRSAPRRSTRRRFASATFTSAAIGTAEVGAAGRSVAGSSVVGGSVATGSFVCTCSKRTKQHASGPGGGSTQGRRAAERTRSSYLLARPFVPALFHSALLLRSLLHQLPGAGFSAGRPPLPLARVLIGPPPNLLSYYAVFSPKCSRIMSQNSGRNRCACQK